MNDPLGTPAQDGTYLKPLHGWTCFFCGETFIHEHQARLHFGNSPKSKSGCAIKVKHGEIGVLRTMRLYEDYLRAMVSLAETYENRPGHEIAKVFGDAAKKALTK